MFTEAEMTKIYRDRAYDSLVDFLPEECPDWVVERAIDIALDETDGEQESDGTWIDHTPYEDCARHALDEWAERERDDHEGRGDYYLHIRREG